MSLYHPLTDRELIIRLKEGDQLAYTEIYNRFNAPVYIHIFNKLHNREEARDIVHDLFSDLWTRKEELDLQSGKKDPRWG